MKRTTWSALLILPVLLVGLSACGPDPRVSMVAIPPPAVWTTELAAARADRDAFFREAPDSPLLPEDRAGFDGLEYYPEDPDLYFVGSIQTYVEPAELDMVTTGGQIRLAARLGWLGFQVDGRPLRLQVYQLLDSPEAGVAGLFLPFKDATSGDTTYGSGRYLKLSGPPGGPYVLDFNRATNPSCAYGEPSRFACPRTPEENWLDLPIEAGERGFRGGVEAGE